MAVSKPSKLPEWADGGSAVIVEPSDPKKSLGWIVEKPPYQFFNWFWNLVWQWLSWFNQAYRPMTTVTAAATSVPLGASIDYAADCTSNGQTYTLPTPANPADNGMVVSIMKTDSSANAVTWGGTISGQVNPTIPNQYTRQSIIAHAGAWYWLS